MIPTRTTGLSTSRSPFRSLRRVPKAERADRGSPDPRGGVQRPFGATAVGRTVAPRMRCASALERPATVHRCLYRKLRGVGKVRVNEGRRSLKTRFEYVPTVGFATGFSPHAHDSPRYRRRRRQLLSLCL